MITPIYSLCTACGGTKVIEHIAHSDFTTTKPSDKRRTDQCPTCKGKGYVPTGDFCLNGSDKDDILTQIEELEDPIAIDVIKKKAYRFS